MDDKEKVWDRLKHGVKERPGSEYARAAQAYFESTDWRKQLARIKKIATESKDV